MSSVDLLDLLACSRLSDGGEGAKEWGRRERERRASPLLSPVSSLVCVFALSQFPRVYSLRPPHFRSNWVAFPNYSSSFDLNNRKEKKEFREEEKSSSMVGVFVILDNVSSLPSWSPEKRRLVHNRKSSVQTYCSFNQLISNHLIDFILDDIQTINFLLSRLYHDSVQIAITEKASSRFDCEQSSLFLFF